MLTVCEMQLQTTVLLSWLVPVLQDVALLCLSSRLERRGEPLNSKFHKTGLSPFLDSCCHVYDLIALDHVATLERLLMIGLRVKT